MTRFIVPAALLCAAIVAFAPRLALAGDPVCVVTGKSVKLHEVSVKPAGSTDAFIFNIRDLPIAAHVPARCGNPMSLHVSGALEFIASRENVWISVNRDITTSDGMITLGRGAQVIDACMKADRVFVTAIMMSDDVLEGENKRPDELVRDVEVPCDALTLDPTPLSDDSDDSDGSDAPDATQYQYWETRRGNKLTLYRKPQTKAASRVIESDVCDGEACIRYLREIKRLGSWVNVAVGMGGVEVRGWVTTKQIRRVDTVIYGGIFCSGDHDSGMSGFGFGTGVIREGVVRRDTVVYEAPGTGAWARFTTATRVKVYVVPKQSWASLTYVPGLSGGWSGMIPLDTITFDPSPVVPKP